MKVEAIPMRSDNYAWLLTASDGDACAVVDPAEAGAVLDLVRGRGLALRWVLLTHHHGDHTDGAPGLAKAFPNVEVVCSEYDRGRIPCATRSVVHGESLSVAGSEATCLRVPGHTLGAVAYHFAQAQALFTGDTLFAAGCGRLFEGTAEQMSGSLRQLAELPASTRVFCGHEYTEKNMRFAASIEPDNPAVQQRLAEVLGRRRQGIAVESPTLAIEAATNPFLRALSGDLVGPAGERDPDAFFAELRARRDRF